MKVSAQKREQTLITLEEKSTIGLIDYDKAKDQIITELALSSEFKNKLRKIIADRQLNALRENYDDIFNEVIIEMCKKDSEYLFKQYIKNKGNIMALALTIAKTFFKVNPKYPDYPNKSIVHKLNYQSTALEKADWISPVDIAYDEDSQNIDAGEVLSDGSESKNKLEGVKDLEEESIDLVEGLNEHLTDKEKKSLQVLLRYFNSNKTVNTERDTYKRLMRTHEGLLDKIKSILEDKGVTSMADLYKTIEQ